MSHTSENNASKAPFKFSPNRCDIHRTASIERERKKTNNMFANKSKILKKSIIMFRSLSLAKKKRTTQTNKESICLLHVSYEMCVNRIGDCCRRVEKHEKKNWKLNYTMKGKKRMNEQTRNTHKPKSGSHNYGLVRRFNPIYISNVCNFRTTVVQVVEKNGESNNAHAEQP